MAERVMSIIVRATVGGEEVERGFINVNVDGKGVLVMSLFLNSKKIGAPLVVVLPQACLFRMLKLRDQVRPIKSNNGYDSLTVNDDVYHRLLDEKP
jgi:hypothetical protein